MRRKMNCNQSGKYKVPLRRYNSSVSTLVDSKKQVPFRGEFSDAAERVARPSFAFPSTKFARRLRVRALIQIAAAEKRPSFFIFDAALGLLISVNGGSQWVHLPGEYITPIGVIPADRSSLRSIVSRQVRAPPCDPRRSVVGKSG